MATIKGNGAQLDLRSGVKLAMVHAPARLGSSSHASHTRALK
ncbi:MAG: hypothetical protein V3S36_06265 [Acidiferrobacterales bacterium]